MTLLDLGVLAERASAVDAYESLDMQRIHDAARHGPADLRAFLARARDLAGEIGGPSRSG